MPKTGFEYKYICALQLKELIRYRAYLRLSVWLSTHGCSAHPRLRIYRLAPCAYLEPGHLRATRNLIWWDDVGESGIQCMGEQFSSMSDFDVVVTVGNSTDIIGFWCRPDVGRFGPSTESSTNCTRLICSSPFLFSIFELSRLLPLSVHIGELQSSLIHLLVTKCALPFLSISLECYLKGKNKCCIDCSDLQPQSHILYALIIDSMSIAINTAAKHNS